MHLHGPLRNLSSAGESAESEVANSGTGLEFPERDAVELMHPAISEPLRMFPPSGKASTVHPNKGLRFWSALIFWGKSRWSACEA